MNRNVTFLLCLQLMYFLTNAQQITLVPDASSVKFKIKSWGLTVDGTFGGLRVDGVWNENDLSRSWFKANIEAKTVDANIDARNNSLRGEDYFYVEKYPKISIRSTSISRTDQGYEMKATLHMRDVEKQITIPFTAKSEGGKVVFDGKFVVERLEYGVGPSTFSLGDEATVIIHCVTKTAQ